MKAFTTNGEECMNTEDKQVNKFWRIKDVAKFIGCSEKHIYELARKGEIPSFKKGKFRYFIPEEVEEWLVQGN